MRKADRDALSRIRLFAQEGKVEFTFKALREIWNLDLGLDELDVCDVLARLTASDWAGRLRSESTGEWMYLFRPEVGGRRVYVKVILRMHCVVVSFHEDVTDGE